MKKEFKEYYKNGSLKTEGFYNLIDPIFDEYGDEITPKISKEKCGTWKRYYNNGKIKYIETYTQGHYECDLDEEAVNAVKITDWKLKERKEYYKSGVLFRHINFEILQGNEIFLSLSEYYENGQEKYGGGYHMGDKIGDWPIYYQNGQLKTDCYYEGGDPAGIWTTYDENGNVIKEEDWSEKYGKNDIGKTSLF